MPQSALVLIALLSTASNALPTSQGVRNDGACSPRSLNSDMTILAQNDLYGELTPISTTPLTRS